MSCARDGKPGHGRTSAATTDIAPARARADPVIALRDRGSVLNGNCAVGQLAPAAALPHGTAVLARVRKEAARKTAIHDNKRLRACRVPVNYKLPLNR
jgi:hypothetical protein